MAKFPQNQQTLTLIPNLPNDISSIILSKIPFCYHSLFKQISKSWFSFYTFYYPFLTRPGPELLVIFPDDPSISSPYLFDPTHLAWTPLPRTPVNPHAYSLSNFSAVSIGRRLFVIGGSVFDTRSFPLDTPTSCSSVFRFDFNKPGVFSGFRGWEVVRKMVNARGSFAVGVINGGIIVAGGGSRHRLFGAGGSREGGVERYDVERDEWVEMKGMPGFRAGCVGFCVRKGGEEEEEFWVMGGYGETRLIAGVLPVDEHCKDVVVMKGGEWSEVGDMWGVGERGRLGKVAVVEDVDGGGVGVEVFMLDENGDICRYNMALNSWSKETTVPRKNPDESSFGFIAIQGELHVISLLTGVELSEIRRSRVRKRGTVLFMQIYNPKTKCWRTLVTRTPFQCSVDFKTAVMCTIRL